MAGAATAALGALVLGEYEFVGYVPWVAGVVLGLLVAEVMLAVGRRRGWLSAGLAAGLAAAGLAWAGWIDSAGGVSPYPRLAWAAAAVGAAAAAFQTRPVRHRPRPGTGDPEPSVGPVPPVGL